MMNKRILIAAGLLIGLSLAASTASAQMYGGRSLGRPTVSPYLNLVTADALGQAGIGGGYQTLVRPFVDQRRAINANAAAVSQLQGQMSRGGGSGAGAAVGTAGRFMNYSHYYGR
jgi:hypothetical protein